MFHTQRVMVVPVAKVVMVVETAGKVAMEVKAEEHGSMNLDCTQSRQYPGCTTLSAANVETAEASSVQSSVAFSIDHVAQRDHLSSCTEKVASQDVEVCSHDPHNFQSSQRSSDGSLLPKKTEADCLVF